jgi:hypothetical protein
MPDASESSPRDAVALFDFRGGGGEPYQDQRGNLTLTTPDDADPTLTRPLDSGLEFAPGGLLVSDTSGEQITAACMASNELSVEIWLTPNGPQEVRSRLVTLSTDTFYRNFALGLGGNDNFAGAGACAEESNDAFGVGEGAAAYFFRRRVGSEDCTTCALNGYPELWTQMISVDRLTHVVATHGADGTDRIYVDASTEAECISAGNFADWDPTYLLKIGGELSEGDRPFSGIIHLVAIYDRALPEAEVQTRFAEGI